MPIACYCGIGNQVAALYCPFSGHTQHGVSAHDLAGTRGDATQIKRQKLHRGCFLPSPDADGGLDPVWRKVRCGRAGQHMVVPAVARLNDIPHFPAAIGIGHGTRQRVDDDAVVNAAGACPSGCCPDAGDRRRLTSRHQPPCSGRSCALGRRPHYRQQRATEPLPRTARRPAQGASPSIQRITAFAATTGDGPDPAASARTAASLARRSPECSPERKLVFGERPEDRRKCLVLRAYATFPETATASPPKADN